MCIGTDTLTMLTKVFNFRHVAGIRGMMESSPLFLKNQ